MKGTTMQKAEVQLLHEDPRARLLALEDLVLDGMPACYAVREVLLGDTDARVRARAAERLGRAPGEHAAAITPWLTEAAEDVLPRVREASLRALSRLATCDLGATAAAARERAARMALLDPIWWVRRTAALALAALAEEAAIPTLLRVLADPFWRVRSAAAQALTLLGSEREATRARILAEPATEAELPAVAKLALLEVRARLSRGINVYAFKPPEPADQPLWNPDPAVTTARLQALPEEQTEPRALLSLLGDPHQPLRELAVQRFFARADQALLREALVHVEVPGVPRAHEAVWAALDQLGLRAAQLAEAVLNEEPATTIPTGAAAWACTYAGNAGLHLLCGPLARLLGVNPERPEQSARPHPDPRARLHAVLALAELVSDAAQLELLLVPRLSDPDEDDEVRAAAARALCRLGTRTALAQVAAARARRELHPAARIALVHAIADLDGCCGGAHPKTAAHTDGAPVLPQLERLAVDPHPLVRATALSRLLIRGALPQAEALLADPDPMVRAALLPRVRERWPELLAADPDARVRRMALQQALRRKGELPAPTARALFDAAMASVDPWLRAGACALCEPQDPDVLRMLLSLSRDPEPMVRAAASGRLLECDPQELGEQLETLLRAARLSDGQRAAAYTLLCRGLDEAAAATTEAALADPREPRVVREQLVALAPLFDDALLIDRPHLAAAARGEGHDEPAPAPQRRRSRRLRTHDAPRRPLGRTGIQVSPLGISGAQGLPEASLYRAIDAGVNLFFWEPGYRELGRFLRRFCARQDSPADESSPEEPLALGRTRQDLVLVAGSYEGDRAGIERDVRRALRRLGTSYLDVFLLFWVRSPERLSDEALQTLRELKQRGLIRAFGFSSHDRPLITRAIESGDWDVVMLRHSAAHPGAESELLPLAAARGVGILTFSALCYGRLLDPLPGLPQPAEPGALPTAAECYRYSLQQPGVSATWSAPRHGRELRENLQALTAGPLPPERLVVLRQHGAAIHAESRRFDALLRKGHADADAAPSPPQRLGALLAELLHAQPPPEDSPEGSSETGSRSDRASLVPRRRRGPSAKRGAPPRALS